MLELKNIYKTFNAGTVNEKQALKGIDLTLEDGLNAGESVVVSADGTDEQAAIENIEKYLSSHN